MEKSTKKGSQEPFGMTIFNHKYFLLGFFLSSLRGGGGSVCDASDCDLNVTDRHVSAPLPLLRSEGGAGETIIMGVITTLATWQHH